MTAAIEKLVEAVSQKLLQKKLKLATAESCTGGGLSYWVTSLSGSSDWYERGFVTYSNAAKIELLGVDPDTIDRFGAVSQETVIEMAEGAMHHSEAEISIAITGIAGPTGGTPEKPVGTVWLALAGSDFATVAESHLFTGDRQTIRLAAIQRALEKLLELL